MTIANNPQWPRIAVAPMMDWTDKHDRYFLRLIAPNSLLYTEMITAQALKHGNAEHLLAYHPAEKPVVLQLGGSDPLLLAQAAKLGETWGYAQINLNVGCPSPRVSAGRFGACLMLEPALVADCIIAMREQVKIPITIKCRIGVDHQDSYSALCAFIEHCVEAGCVEFIIHARKAWLSGLSPKQNREIPPLRYEVAQQIKQDFPFLTIWINGGIKTLAEVQTQLQSFDGVMLGRAAYHNPYLLAAIQAHEFPQQPVLSRHQVINALLPYVDEQLKIGVKLTQITRHLLGLFQGQPGAAAWRRYISTHAHHQGAGRSVLEDALGLVVNE